MGTAQECGVAPLPAAVTLRDPWIHVSGPNGSDGPAEIERVVYQQLCFGSILRVLYIKLNDSHIRFMESLDNPWFSYKSHRFE